MTFIPLSGFVGLFPKGFYCHDLFRLIFLCVFLPIFLLVYLFTPGQRRRNLVLLIFSLIFYGFGGVGYLLLLVVLAAVSYFLGLFLGAEDAVSRRQIGLIAGVTLYTAILFLFKYTGFFLGSLGALFRADWAIPRLALPLGISFYTFKLISYVADVYMDRVKAETDFLAFLLYVVIFHQALQGPIIRDFWRCWHISLIQFFRDYIYIPLGGSRQGLPVTVRNTLVVWILTGLWHGAS